MHLFKVGSQLLKLQNMESDADYLIITEDKCDIRVRTLSELRKMLSLEEDLTFAQRIAIYQYDRDIIGKDFPIEFHILDHKSKIINILKRLIGETVWANSHGCKKELYHLYYMVYILENNSVKLTDEQFNTVKLIHDRKAPPSYFTSIKEKIYKMYNELPENEKYY